MPKPVTHKSINVRLATYDQLVEITDQLAKEKGVPVSIPTTIDLLIECWQGAKK